MRAFTGIFVLPLAVCLSLISFAQTDEAAQKIDLGIIVMPTMKDAQSILKQLKNGTEFSVLAKENSIDASAVDGGYVGKIDPNTLRLELRKAALELKTGEISDVVQISSGFAVLKAFASPPATSDLNPKQISALLATGAIRIGPQVDGLVEANAVLRDYVKDQPSDWNRDLAKTCELRKTTLAGAKTILTGALAPGAAGGEQYSPLQKIQGHTVLAQLYGYSGEMEKSVTEWKAAYDLAQTADPNYLPNLEESLGASYLHMSEMEERHLYATRRDLDIFPAIAPSSKL